MPKARRITKPKKPARGDRYRAIPLEAPGGVFLPDKEQLVRMIAMRGASDAEIEAVYGLGSGTIDKWRKHYPNFDKALLEGRTIADGDVLYASYKTAVGYCYEEEQAVGGRDPQVLTVKRHKPGEHAAQKYWMNNRQREHWKTRENVEAKNTNLHGLEPLTRNSLIDSIVKLVSSKPDPEKPREKDRPR